MTIMDVLAGFAESGGIGVLRPGATLPDVSRRLGPPENGEYFPSRRRKRGEPRNLRYGDVRLEVCCDIVRAVALSTGTGSVDVPGDTPGRMRTIASTVTIGQLREAFSAAGTRAEEGLWPEPDDQVTLVVPHDPADVHFTFRRADPDDPEGSGTTLHSAIARDTQHVCR
jgi:hypothetical protein